MATLGIAATSTGLAGGAEGCSAFEDLKLAPPRSEAGAAGVAAGCVPTHPPGPSYMPEPLGGTSEFVVAPWHLDLGDAVDAGTPVYQSIGYDLDGVCTTRDAGYSCKEPSWATALHSDGPGGRDNSVAADIYSQNVLQHLGEGAATSVANSGQANGGLLLAIRVSGYNGLAVDGSVTVTFYGVTFHRGLDAGGSFPRWDGTDAYDVGDPWLAPAEAGGSARIDQPMYQDTNAYVTTGGPTSDGLAAALLVSKVDSLLIGGGPFHMRQVVMTAEIVQSASSWVLRNGTFQGRIPIDELLHNVADAPDMTTRQPFCLDSPNYPLAKATTCAYADISYSGPDDGTQPCDAASWAWRFVDSTPIALVGVVGGPPAPTNGCKPGMSPRDDHCGP